MTRICIDAIIKIYCELSNRNFYRDGLGHKTDCKENAPSKVGNGFGGITLTYNVESKEEVDKTIELVKNVNSRYVR